MASRNPDDLVPELLGLYQQFKERMKEAGISFLLTCTARSAREQVALYAQGRAPVSEVNALRKHAGLPAISRQINNAGPVTWTLASKHIIDLDDGIPENDLARAFDIAIVKDGRPCWDLKTNVNANDVPDYQEAGRIGDALGLRWGGRFRKPDFVHFELP